MTFEVLSNSNFDILSNMKYDRISNITILKFQVTESLTFASDKRMSLTV